MCLNGLISRMTNHFLPVYARPERSQPADLYLPYLAFLEVHVRYLFPEHRRDIQRTQCMGLGKLSGAPGGRTI